MYKNDTCMSRLCRNGFCEDAALPNGNDTCQKDYNCQSGHCIDGTCRSTRNKKDKCDKKEDCRKFVVDFTKNPPQYYEGNLSCKNDKCDN